jgi:hypothetical protein
VPLRDATEQWSTKRGLTSLNLTGQAPSVAAECCTLVRFEKRINMFDQKPPPWALKIFYLIFPERFKIMGIDAEIEALAKGWNTVFKPYAL